MILFLTILLSLTLKIKIPSFNNIGSDMLPIGVLNISFLNFDLKISHEVSHRIAFIRDRVDFVRLGPRTSPDFVQRIESSDELAVGLTAMFRF